MVEIFPQDSNRCNWILKNTYTYRRKLTVSKMVSQAVVIVDDEGVIHTWSQGAESLFGYEASEVLGQKLDLMIPEEYRERHWAGFFAAMKTGLKGVEGEASQSPVLCKDGQIKTYPARLFLLRDARSDHEIVGAFAIFSPKDA
jgi:PAS domain S-box-containing protein